MEVVIGSKRFSLKVKEAPTQDSHASDEGVASERIVYHSEAGLSGLLIACAFYNACLRWVSGENIAKKLSYEFLICLTGETQLNRLLKKTVCSPETHASNPVHYYFEVSVAEDETGFATQAQKEAALTVGRPTRQDRLKLAEIQLKLLSKSP